MNGQQKAMEAHPELFKLLVPSEIEKFPMRGRCQKCGHDFVISNTLVCPKCHGR
jgi:hypothetical protein